MGGSDLGTQEDFPYGALLRIRCFVQWAENAPLPLIGPIVFLLRQYPPCGSVLAACKLA
jgi:hypothetical protein